MRLPRAAASGTKGLALRQTRAKLGKLFVEEEGDLFLEAGGDLLLRREHGDALAGDRRAAVPELWLEEPGRP